jgi:hypothetical protein
MSGRGKLHDPRACANCVAAFAAPLGTATNAAAQNVTPPATSTTITREAGNSAFLLGRGVGTQGCVRLPSGAGASLRAGLSDHHAFLSPNTNPDKFAPDPLPFGKVTWQSSLDSSKVWAQTVHSVAAGSEPSCPNGGAIGCPPDWHEGCISGSDTRPPDARPALRLACRC